MPEEIRCSHCKLNQFDTASGNCRRCKKNLYAVAVATLPTPIRLSTVDDAFVEILGMEIYRARRATGLSQRQFGKIMGVPRTYISKVERGKTLMRIPNLISCGHALGIPGWQLLKCAEESMEQAKTPRASGTC